MNPFDIVKNINNKSGVLSEADVKGQMFIVNRALSNTMDTVLLANEANKLRGLSDYDIYLFLYHAIPRNPKRFGKWQKMDNTNKEAIDMIMELYNYNRQKAEEVVHLFSVQTLKELTYKGGKK